MNFIPYNSRHTYHKSPFGAVECGTPVTLRFILPRDCSCRAAWLVIAKDGEDEKYIEMQWDGMQGDSEEWWKCTYIPKTAGLYFYRFAFERSWGTSGIFRTFDSCGEIGFSGEKWQLTVYSADLKTPEWIKGSVIYQIFPDRFCASGEKKTCDDGRKLLRDDWGGAPLWEPDGGGKIERYDFFGGDLRGIEQKLGYLESLGVGCIYLNPVFSALSNHRYDTADYLEIDPILGDEAAFESLCREAEKHGISIILDGVFSHTGADSVYFNKFSKYPSVGAYNSKDSDYYGWYSFRNFPDDYACWWGVDILPEVNEENEDYLEFITGENGVARKWLRAGARGWRLDVADELPDKFLDRFYSAVKSENPDAYILGEVWEDASNKISYSHRRRYLQGGQLDSVMNYPFADAIIGFVISGKAEGFNSQIMTVTENYPKPCVDTLMNHIGTHDTCRVINRLATGDAYYSTHLDRYRGELSPEQKERGEKLLKLAATLQFTLPGVPCVFYGDEAGLTGGVDPFNRVCFPWGNENADLQAYYKKLGTLRKEHAVFAEGEFVPVSDALGCVAFERRGNGGTVTVVANRNEHEIVYTLAEKRKCLFGGEMLSEKDVRIPALTAAVLTD